MFACTYIYTTVWVYTGEINTKRIREKYLQAILHQEIAYFDSVGAGEITTRIQTDTRMFFLRTALLAHIVVSADLVQQGVSEKVALVVTFTSAFFTGFILAYARSWKLALAMSSIIPCIGITGAIMNKFMSKNMQSVSFPLSPLLRSCLDRRSLAQVSAGGTIAEEVISTIRTAHAFGTQNILRRLYDAHIQQALSADASSTIFRAAGYSIFFFVMYAAYALGTHPCC